MPRTSHSTPADPREKVDAVIFVPFIAREYEMFIDTLDSIAHYVREPHRVIAVDDCSCGRPDERLRRERPGVVVLRNARPHGARSGLYVTMAAACKYALAHYRFTVFMKMDTDALMVGPGLIGAAVEYFSTHPRAGILGSYRVRADGQRRSWLKWKAAFYYESSPLRRLAGASPLWREPLRAASQHGYDVGENVLGGAYLVSAACLRLMNATGYLDYEHARMLSESRMGEDVIFSLFCRATGLELHDFGAPGQGLAVALDALPLDKEAILRNGTMAVHSLKRGAAGETQEELRRFFRAARQQPVGT